MTMRRAPGSTSADGRDTLASLQNADQRLTPPTTGNELDAAVRRLSRRNQAELRNLRATGPAGSRDAADRYRSNDSIVAQRQRGEMPLGQWNAGDLKSMRDHRPGIEIERQGVAFRNQQTLSARLARGEQPLEAPEGRSFVRPDGTDTAA